MTQPVVERSHSSLFLALCAYGGTLACLLWAFWTTLADAAHRWSSDPSYSHGYLVPVFAAILLWLRRAQMPPDLLRPNWLLGVLVLTAGVVLRLVGTYYHFVFLDPIALLPCVAGVCLLLGGWPVGRWVWPSVLFLAFMIPLPYRMAGAMAGDLQSFATTVSTFLLQSLGMPALAEGNVILLSKVDMGIVEACSGLRMLFVFFALSTAFALLVQRNLWEKLVIVVSAVPIALACNVIRITATGVLHETVGSDIANAVFHDFAGWLMMPMGLAMLWFELKIMKLLWLEDVPPSEDQGRYAPVRPVSPQPVATPTPTAATPAPTRARRPWKPAKSSRAAVGLSGSSN